MSMSVQGLPSSQSSPTEKLLMQPAPAGGSSQESSVQGSSSLQVFGSGPTHVVPSQWSPTVQNSPSEQLPVSVNGKDALAALFDGSESTEAVVTVTELPT